ncbi:hypothetical protein NKH77_22090 [Streptomyces sp. M19]
MISNSGHLGRNTLIRMIQFRVIDRAAKDNGCAPRAATSSRRARVLSGRRGRRGAARHVPGAGHRPGPDRRRGADGPAPHHPAARARHRQGEPGVRGDLQKLDIEVNPRYGTWDDTQGTAVLVKDKWLRTTPAPAQPA